MARLTQSYTYDKRIKVDAEAPRLDPKNCIHAAVQGKLIRDINNGNYDDVANLQVVAKAVHVEGSTTPVKIGEETITVLNDGTSDHELSDPGMVKAYCDQGMKIVKTFTRDIMG